MSSTATAKSSVKRVVRVSQKRSGTVVKSNSEVSFPKLLATSVAVILVAVPLILQISPSIYAYTHRIRSSSIRVFDNVLSPEMSLRMHDACSAYEGGNVFFEWPVQSIEELHKRTYIEQVIHQIVSELEEQPISSNSSKQYYVEYWARQAWQHVQAHADLDEVFLRQREQSNADEPNPVSDRYPRFGHVLYLKLGSKVNGPTVVIPNASKGGDLIQPNLDVEMLVVPAVQGRLLRFKGDLLHAVPRPSDRWLNFEQEESVGHEPEEDVGRSVVLFNLWAIDEPPPMEQRLTDPVEKNQHDELCNARGEWRSVESTSDYEGSYWHRVLARTRVFQLPLMGLEERRGTKETSLQLRANSFVQQAFRASQDDDRPKRLYLQQKEPAVGAIILPNEF